jgi:mannose-6-phosphate isomerase-like protein (cupin superfamily)
MSLLVEPGSILNLGKETMTFTATPAETGDRYTVRMTVDPGGGPGIRGFGPHIHDGLTEIFTVVSGIMKYRLGRRITEAGPGDRVEVAPGTVHGFKNVGEDELAVDVEIVFGPEGPTPETDLVSVGVTIARLMEEGKISRLTGYPPMLQLAVVECDTPRAMREAGVPGLLMPPLAWLGRRLGYKPDPFEDRP